MHIFLWFLSSSFSEKKTVNQCKKSRKSALEYHFAIQIDIPYSYYTYNTSEPDSLTIRLGDHNDRTTIIRNLTVDIVWHVIALDPNIPRQISHPRKSDCYLVGSLWDFFQKLLVTLFFVSPLMPPLMDIYIYMGKEKKVENKVLTSFMRKIAESHEQLMRSAWFGPMVQYEPRRQRYSYPWFMRLTFAWPSYGYRLVPQVMPASCTHILVK